MFTIRTDGTIQTDSLDDALSLSARLSAKGVADPDEPIPFKVTEGRRAAPLGRCTCSLLHTGACPSPLATTKPRAVRLALPTVTAKGTPGKRRPLGTGSVYSPNKGASWCWSIGPRADRTVKHGFATRAEAEAALDAHLAGGSAPAVLPPPHQRRHFGEACG